MSVALLGCAVNQAFASGFMVREKSAESLGMVFAGDASRADEAATVFNNPAGMIRLAPEVEGTLAGVLPHVHFSGSATAAGVIPITGDQGGQPGQSTAIPALFGVFGISPDIKVGLAVTVPFGLEINYGPNWVGRYQGIKLRALSADINPAVAWRVNDKVSIGAGISAQWFKVEESAAIPQFLILQAPVPDASFLFNGSNWNIGYNFGLLLSPNETTRLGFTYRSAIDHIAKGSLDFTGASPFLPVQSGAAKASGLNMPGDFAASFTHDFTPQFSASAELQYDFWGAFKQVTVTSANTPLVQIEHYRNSWMFTMGGIYRLTPVLQLRGGLGWDQSPVTDRYRTVGVPDADRYMIGIGAGYAFTPGTVLDFGFSHYFGKDPTVTGSVNSVDPFTQAIVLTGKYHNTLDFLALSLRFAL
jgi:long-chain fatty acid transport protein